MRIIGFLLAVVMVAAGGFLAFAGMGYVGSGSGTSRTWSMIGSLLAAFGVALAISLGRRPR